ncbi:hypothetical protein HPB49_014714 [Dermacentor silvarum]|uniref:Uncharacterized protein n=1 Tax=Dermacentor silvarum TaxID=543639 RepID=A0ACB8CS19_DERSI|nr:hypothetical protein HPB49_014714 [Dermacentor silvarum]
MDTNDADEIGNLLVDLDGARGIFTGTLIDYRMPCTVSEDTTCQIVSNLSVWNEFLCWIHLELRELPETGRQIGLSLRLNRSITEFGIGACDSPPDDVAVVGEAVRRSATIRKICILEWSAQALLSFMCGLSAGIVKNRTLCHTASDYDEWAYNVEGWFAVYDTARRNSGFVARSAQFLNHGRCDR